MRHVLYATRRSVVSAVRWLQEALASETGRHVLFLLFFTTLAFVFAFYLERL